jgi:AcrR family transcriptional regulator
MPPRRDREIERTRRDILDAAARAFARSSFIDATMQDIAKEAGYTAASLYTYFRSKQEIFLGLLELLNEDFLATYDEQLPESLTFGQRLEILLHRQFEIADRRRDAFLVFLSVRSSPQMLQAAWGSQPASEWKKVTDMTMEVFVKRLAHWISDVGKGTSIGPRDPTDLAHFLMGIVHSSFTRWLRGGAVDRLANQAQLLVDMFLHGAMGSAQGLPRAEHESSAGGAAEAAPANARRVAVKAPAHRAASGEAALPAARAPKRGVRARRRS